MRSIMTAAGMGSRLLPYTEDIPKCLVNIASRPMLERALDVFGLFGLTPLTVIGGYKKEKLQHPDIELISNDDYKNNNILQSLFYARDLMSEAFLYSYSDIVFRKEIVEDLLKSSADITLVVDRDWKQNYIGRDLHPESEAELVEATDGRVTAIGKHVSGDSATGEFIGMALFSKGGARLLKDVFLEIEKHFQETGEHPFGHAKNFQQAYFTDLIGELCARGHEVTLCEIQGGWMEVDTPQDLEKAHLLVSQW